MDFDTGTTVDEQELDALGIKKKSDDAVDDVDAVADDAIVDTDLTLEKEKEEAEKKGIFGDDPELEAYMLGEEEKGSDMY